MSNLSYPKKIVKNLFLLSLIFFQLADAKAQNRYGIMIGAGNTALNKKPFTSEEIGCYSSRTSYWAGIAADFDLGTNGLSLLTAPLYNKKGYDYFLQNQSGANNTLKDSACTQDLNYLDLNLILRKKFSISDQFRFFIGAGPSVSIFLSGTEEITKNYFGSSNPDVKTTENNLPVGNAPGAYKRVFLGLGTSLGFEFRRFSVWANYNLALDYYYVEPTKEQQYKINSFGLNASYAIFAGQQPEREKKEKREKKERPALPAVIIAKDTTTDTDADGIADINDKCPGHKGIAKYGGCPVPDTDGDGINDDEDKCPLVAGLAASNGCPAFTVTETKATKDTLRYIVYFEPGKSELRSNGFNTLSEVVRLLKANPKLVVQFNGHTDNVGSVEANNTRAFDRATVCADYVASYFIDRKRLAVTAFGNKKPAADLNDPLLQWKNRRVEVVVFEKEE